MLTGGAGEVLACALLAVVIVTATTRPRLLPEPVAAVAAAALLLLTGVLSVTQARAAASRLLPVLGFLAAILVLGYLCERAGLFAAAGARLARAAGPGPEPDTGTAPARPPARPVRLLAGVYLLASVTTAVLSLDTTVVLLTPVVYRSARQLRVPPRPHVYACAHLANSASLLLPVSNLTNLLAFAVSGLTLSGFCTLMAGPWAAAIAVEYIVFRRFFAADLARQPEPPADLARQPEPPADLARQPGPAADLARRAGLGVESAAAGTSPLRWPGRPAGTSPRPCGRAGPGSGPVVRAGDRGRHASGPDRRLGRRAEPGLGRPGGRLRARRA